MTRGVWGAGVSRKGKECEARLREPQDDWVTRGRTRAFGSGFWLAALGLGGVRTREPCMWTRGRKAACGGFAAENGDFLLLQPKQNSSGSRMESPGSTTGPSTPCYSWGWSSVAEPSLFSLQRTSCG